MIGRRAYVSYKVGSPGSGIATTNPQLQNCVYVCARVCVP